MNIGDLLLWGFVASIAQATTLATSQALGLSRMGMPTMLGTMVTANRDRALFAGIGVHVVVGWAFAVIYALIFDRLGHAGWLTGTIIGCAHGIVMLVLLLPALPAVHPRMASERDGPDPTRALEPPGFLALNYGFGTPVVVLLSHLMFGAILGGFYRVGH